MDKKIDRRRKYFMIIDTETANSLDDPLVYDIGLTVCDRHGNIYEKRSWIIYDVFVLEKELMQSAYYASKIPRYEAGLKVGEYKLINFMTARKLIHQLMKEYRIKDVGAFNGGFDLWKALNITLRYITKSKFRWFFPYGTRLFCVWHMACQVICMQPSYQKWTRYNGFISKIGNIRTDAETVYRYYHGNDFRESHTGLDDAIIETFIFSKCIAQHKTMKRNIYKGCWSIPNKKDIKAYYSSEPLQITMEMVAAGILPR